MRTNRAVTLQTEYASRISEVYSETVQFGRSHLQHIERMKERIWNPSQAQKIPYWLRSYLRGFDHAKWNALYETREGHTALLESVSIGPDGRIFTRTDNSWLAENHEYKSNMRAEYRWRHKPECYW